MATLPYSTLTSVHRPKYQSVRLNMKLGDRDEAKTLYHQETLPGCIGHAGHSARSEFWATMIMVRVGTMPEPQTWSRRSLKAQVFVSCATNW